VPLADLLRQLDPRPDIRGRQFERICKWFLQNAPEYRRRFRRVWLWSEWPDAWAPDAGIDLVAEERDGGFWAIQAKAYDPGYAIKMADVDSFLAESSRPGFTYRLLIATTDRLGPTARRTLDDQREPVGYLLRSQLELARVQWPASPDALRPRAARKRPFPHVREAIRATVRGFKETDRGQLIMACGTGKTLAAMWIAERLDSTRTLILVPSLSLLSQTLREWSANATRPFDYLAVCSDETVAGEDEFVPHTSELGLPVTTDPEVIAAFLRRHGHRVVFATYQSSPQIAAAYEGPTPRFDLAVADEAHRCAGRVSSEFATILDPDRIKARRRLFMTATPRLFTPRVRREAGQLDVEVASMDDESVFGPVLHRLTFGEGIERDLLSDYQVVVVGVDDEMYRSYAERGEFVTTDGKTITDARTLAGQIGLAKTIRKYGLRGRLRLGCLFSAIIEREAQSRAFAWQAVSRRIRGGPHLNRRVSPLGRHANCVDAPCGIAPLPPEPPRAGEVLALIPVGSRVKAGPSLVRSGARSPPTYCDDAVATGAVPRDLPRRISELCCGSKSGEGRLIRQHAGSVLEPQTDPDSRPPRLSRRTPRRRVLPGWPGSAGSRKRGRSATD
jgi:predicted helicase